MTTQSPDLVASMDKHIATRSACTHRLLPYASCASRRAYLGCQRKRFQARQLPLAPGAGDTNQGQLEITHEQQMKVHWRPGK